MSDCAVRVEKITKEYKLYESEFDRLKEAFHPFKKSYHRLFFALKDVSFEIAKGEKVGIIGANGAGKSTLLKIITEVLNPSGGNLEIHGKVAALLELGAGFNQNYTGLENIRLNGMLMGLTPEELEERKKKIIEFADIGEFIDQPVKNYSSGMFVRLAFATQIFSDPDILIVDEALSVGDIRFQQKCYRAMDALMKDKTVVLVTHDTAAVTRFCKRVIWLNHGEIAYDGEVTEGLKRYQEFLINQTILDNARVGRGDYNDIEENEELAVRDGEGLIIPDVAEAVHYKGNGQAKIYKCGLYDESYHIVDVLEPKSIVKCIVCVEMNEIARHPIIGLAVRDRLGNEIIGINSQTLGIELPVAKERQEYEFTFMLPELNKGEYTISIAIANGYQADHIQMCWLDDALIFRVPERKYDIPGLLYLDKGTINVFKVDV